MNLNNLEEYTTIFEVWTRFKSPFEMANSQDPNIKRYGTIVQKKKKK